MPTETIGDYEIEYAGLPLPEGAGWGAYVAVFGPSPNPMHRNSIFPHHRVAVETVFTNEHAAEEEARKIALSLIN